MTTDSPAYVAPDQNDPAVRKGQEDRLREVWKPPSGWFFRWTDVNNNRIGVWYTLTAFGFMLFAGVLALIMRTQLAVPNNDLVTANTFNQLFTLHGSMPNRSPQTRKTVLAQLYSGADAIEESNRHPNVRLVLRGWNHAATRSQANRVGT